MLYKQEVQKVEKLRFFQRGSSMLLAKNWPFSMFFWQYRPGKCVLQYSRTKNAFLSYKNKKFKKSKNWHFSKGVSSMVLIQKWPFFYLFFLGNVGHKKVFSDIPERKKPFLG